MSDIELKAHPLATIFPRPTAKAQQELGESLASRGQRDLIVLLEGMILDGLTRYTECRARGIVPKFRMFDSRPVAEGGDGPSPLDYVEDKNLHRRDLTTGQRAWIAAELEELRHGGRRNPASADQAANLPLETVSARATETRAELAERQGVSEKSIQHAARVRDEGAPELKAALKQGQVVPDVAATIAEGLPKDEQTALLASLPRDEKGELTPDAARTVRKLAGELREKKTVEKRQRREARERQQGAMQLATVNKYGVILEDPEWDFTVYSRETGMDRHAANHYVVSPDKVLEERPVFDLAADDAVYGLWTADLARGLDLLRKRGFIFKSYFVWVKDVVDFIIEPATLKQLGLPERRYLQVIGAPGTGFWNRDRDEILLIGVRGNPPCPAMGTQGESVWFAPRPHIEGTEKDRHSAKPDICFDWFDQHFPSFRKIELNARIAREGWDRWGLEAPPSEEPAAQPDEDSSDELPAIPWAASGDDDAEQHAAEAQAESDNEAAEAGASAP